jgi:di/tripeptidase
LAKLSLQRLLEVSKLLATDAGSQLEELITFVNDLADQTLRALRQGLTLSDNINCLVQTIQLKHNVESVLNTDSKTPVAIIPARVYSSTTGINGFIWYVNSKNEVIVKASFLNTPTDSQKCVLIIHFN